MWGTHKWIFLILKDPCISGKNTTLSVLTMLLISEKAEGLFFLSFCIYVHGLDWALVFLFLSCLTLAYSTCLFLLLSFECEKHWGWRSLGHGWSRDWLHLKLSSGSGFHLWEQLSSSLCVCAGAYKSFMRKVKYLYFLSTLSATKGAL